MTYLLIAIVLLVVWYFFLREVWLGLLQQAPAAKSACGCNKSPDTKLDPPQQVALDQPVAFEGFTDGGYGNLLV